jgi:hypothetical protein
MRCGKQVVAILSMILTTMLSMAVWGQTQPPLWGMHTNHMPSFPIQIPYDCWRNLSATGSGDASNWATIQTGPSSYNFELIDQAMTDLAAANKTCIVFTPEWTPSFIANTIGYNTDGQGTRTCSCHGGGNMCYPPKDLNADGSGTDQTFKNFITALSAHVHANHTQNPNTYADIKYWSSGNEYLDNPQQFCGSYMQLARMLTDEKCIIRGEGPGCTTQGINPEANVMTVAMFSDTNAKIYLATLPNIPGAVTPAQLANLIDTHNTYVSWKTPENVVAQMLSFENIVNNNPQSKGKKIFVTEGGWDAPPPDTWAHAETFMGRFMIAASSTGLFAHIFFGYDFYSDNTPEGPGGCCTTFWSNVNTTGCTIIANPGYFCSDVQPYNQVVSWLKDVTFDGPCTSQTNVWTCDIQSTGNTYQTGMFVWYSVLDGSTQYTIPSGIIKMQTITGQISTVKTGQVITIDNNPVLFMGGQLPTAPQSLQVGVK